MSEQTMGQEQTPSEGPAEGSRLGQGADNRQTGQDTVDTSRDRQDDPRVSEASGQEAQAETPAERNLSGDRDDQDAEQGDEQGGDESSEADRRSAEEFAAEHDPEKHDIAAGEELRQRGDWTADDTGGPQVWDAEGHLVDGAGPGTADAQASGSDDHDHHDHDHDHDHDHETGGRRRTSSIEEIRDGGYGVGSAAPLDDHASPFGHPVKAWNDTRTFVDTDHPRYHDAEPHVWFADTGAAEQAGFRRADD